MPVNNFIFDMYGTLADIRTDEWSDAFWQRAEPYFKSKSARDIDFKAEFEALLKKRASAVPNKETDIAGILRELFIIAGAEYSDEQIFAIGSQIRALSVIKLRLYPGVYETLGELKSRGKGLYLLSNAQACFTMPELKNLDILQFFDGVELSSDFGFCKPDKKFFIHTLRKYALNAEESLYIGNDYRNDVRGAAGAGLKSVYIRTETSPKRNEPRKRFTAVKAFLDGDFSALSRFLLEL